MAAQTHRKRATTLAELAEAAAFGPRTGLPR